MGDLWLPGLPPAYSSWAQCKAELVPLLPTEADAVILAACAGHESGYDMRVINDTPATGDYSVGLYQINYFESLAPSRTAEFGTPRQLIISGVKGQSRAAATLWHQAGGFSPWAADIIGGVWKKYVGSGPIPAVPGSIAPSGLPVISTADAAAVKASIKSLGRANRQIVYQLEALRPIGLPGWRP